MALDIICPSCGFRNPPDAESCGSCNYPLRSLADPHAADDAPSQQAELSGAPTYAPRRVLRRPQRRAAPMSGTSMWLWLFFGSIAVAILLWTAIDANRQRNTASTAVEGTTADQQKAIDAARTVLDKDSSDVEAHLALANVMYDTGHWDDAIVHYRAVLRRDSTRVPPMVDLGVCYYNQGDTGQAEALFQRAIRLDPHQPIALFNLGIVAERRGQTEQALEFYHRAVESAPSDELKQMLVAAVQRTASKAGKKPPPLPGATTP